MPKDSAFNVLGTSIELGEVSTGVLSSYVVCNSTSDATVGSGTWTHGDRGVYGRWAMSSGATNGENLTWSRFLAKGTYEVTTMTFNASYMGIVKIDIDGATVHTHDCYSAGVVNGANATTGSVTVTESGQKTIKLKIDGKNASSSGYSCYMGMIILNRTGD